MSAATALSNQKQQEAPSNPPAQASVLNAAFATAEVATKWQDSITILAPDQRSIPVHEYRVIDAERVETLSNEDGPGYKVTYSRGDFVIVNGKTWIAIPDFDYSQHGLIKTKYAFFYGQKWCWRTQQDINSDWCTIL